MANNDDVSPSDTRRRSRLIHRIGVALFLLILGAALSGLMGKGPLSKMRAGSIDAGLDVEYFRFIRYQAPVELKIAVNARAVTNGMIQLQLSKAFVQQVEIQRIDPEPAGVSGGADFFAYDIRSQTNAPTQVTIRFLSTHFGRLRYAVGLAEGPKVDLQHFAFP